MVIMSLQRPHLSETLPHVPHTSGLGRVISILMSLFLAFCTAIGPLFRAGGSLADFGVFNAAIGLIAFVVYLGLIIALQRARDGIAPAWATHPSTAPRAFRQKLARAVTHATQSWKMLFLVLLIGWAWVPLLLNTSFGADILGQQAEVSNAVRQMLYGNVAYHTGFTQMDVYPIAHYLWPSDPTFLTNQHNIVLTLLYGIVLGGSKFLLHTEVPGVLLLGLAQYAFAAFCCAVTARRFLVLKSTLSVKLRGIVLAILLFSPMITLSTLSLTKSPLSGFVMVWWLGILYQVLHTHSRCDRATVWALVGSTAMMLITAKYDLYIVLIEALVLLIAHRKQWKTWLAALVLPAVVFEIALLSLTHAGVMMEGDSVESKALQIQQIARVAKYSPESISPQARKLLSPIFDIDEMGAQYFPNDADRVKSSGAEGKVTTYKWRTVTAADWKNFNTAWLQIGKAAPLEYLDAFCAEFYGYFDVADQPYVPLLYYYDSPAVTSIFTSNYTSFAPRAALLGFLRGWSEIPVLGWFFHGNFWVIATLLIMCAALRRGHYRKLLWQLPLLVQMAVMVAAPANNFDRHMIGIAAMFAFVLFDYFMADDSTSHDSHLQRSRL